MASSETKSKELKRIYDRDGKVTAPVLVKESKPKKAPLHDEFEWNDAVAANEYRLSQSRRIIKTTVIIRETGKRQHFVHVQPVKPEGPTAATAAPGYYKPIDDVQADPDEYRLALEELQKQMRGLQKSIQRLEKGGPEKKRGIDIVRECIRAANNQIILMIEESAA